MDMTFAYPIDTPGVLASAKDWHRPIAIVIRHGSGILRVPVRIHHVVASIDPKYGGPSYTVPALCRALAELGHEVTLHHCGEPLERSANYEVRGYHWSRLFPGLGLSRDMPNGLRNAAKAGHVLHVHGQWILPNLLPAWAVKGTACRLVTSPRGMLEGWAMQQSAWKKRIMWRTLQRAAVQASDLLHATARSEADSIWALGIDRPAAIIPNGMDAPPQSERAHFGSESRTLLFLGRMHPKKGIDRLLAAWALLQSEHPSWNLKIVGPDNSGYLSELRAQADALKLQRLTFLGAVAGAEKTALYRNSQLFVLPTHSENFGVSVAEALSYGVPAVVSRGAPWAELNAHRCGLWTDNDPAALASALGSLMRRPPHELQEMGARGRAWVERDFSWRRCAEMMAASYRWLLAEAERPDWIVNPS